MEKPWSRLCAAEPPDVPGGEEDEARRLLGWETVFSEPGLPKGHGMETEAVLPSS